MVAAVMTAHEAVERALIVFRLPALACGDPGVKLALKRIEVPARKVAPAAFSRLIRERMEQWQGLCRRGVAVGLLRLCFLARRRSLLGFVEDAAGHPQH